MLGEKILVTGGAGYIGSHVIIELKSSGYTPVVIDNLSTGHPEALPDDVPIYIGDVGNSELVRGIFTDHEISAVMHFAASISVPESMRTPLQYYTNNVVNTISLVEQCLLAEVNAFIFSSTAAVYAPEVAGNVTEASRVAPLSPYGRSKLFAEQILNDLCQAFNPFHVVCLRYFNAAGADPLGRTGQRGLRPTHLIGSAIEVALGLCRELEVFGGDYDTRDGTGERDYIHVTDLATAHICALRYLLAGGHSEVFNCGYGRGSTVLEVVAALERITGRTLPVRFGARRPGDAARVVADATKIKDALGWEPHLDDLSAIIESALCWRERLIGRRPPP